MHQVLKNTYPVLYIVKFVALLQLSYSGKIICSVNCAVTQIGLTVDWITVDALFHGPPLKVDSERAGR